MPLALGFEVRGLDAVKRSNARLVQDLFDAENRGTLKAALMVEREARRRVTAGRSKNKELLHVRSGALRASLNTSPIERHGRDVSARVGFRKGTVDRYAGVHEYGATIRAKGGGYLAIPLTSTKAGNSKSSGPLAYKGTGAFFYTSKKGNLVFGFAGQPPLFALKKEVKIPRRAPLARAAQTVRPRFRSIMDAELAVVAQRYNLGR